MRRARVWKVRRASGTWQLRWWSQGLQCSESTGTADEAEAERMRLRKEGALLAGISATIRGVEMQDLVRLWTESRPGKSGKYEHEVEVCVRRFVQMVGRNGRLRSDRVDAAMVDRYCRRRREEQSVYTNFKGTVIRRPPVSVQRVRADLRMLRAVFNFGLHRVRPAAVAENPVPMAAANKVQAMPAVLARVRVRPVPAGLGRDAGDRAVLRTSRGGAGSRATERGRGGP